MEPRPSKTATWMKPAGDIRPADDLRRPPLRPKRTGVHRDLLHFNCCLADHIMLYSEHDMTCGKANAWPIGTTSTMPRVKALAAPKFWLPYRVNASAQ